MAERIPIIGPIEHHKNDERHQTGSSYLHEGQKLSAATDIMVTIEGGRSIIGSIIDLDTETVLEIKDGNRFCLKPNETIRIDKIIIQKPDKTVHKEAAGYTYKVIKEDKAA